MFLRLAERLRQFMYGRYGNDKLNSFLFVLLVILAAINLFFHSGIVYIIQWLLLVVVILRATSKNLL